MNDKLINKIKLFFAELYKKIQLILVVGAVILGLYIYNVTIPKLHKG